MCGRACRPAAAAATFYFLQFCFSAIAAGCALVAACVDCGLWTACGTDYIGKMTADGNEIFTLGSYLFFNKVSPLHGHTRLRTIKLVRKVICSLGPPTAFSRELLESKLVASDPSTVMCQEGLPLFVTPLDFQRHIGLRCVQLPRVVPLPTNCAQK